MKLKTKIRLKNWINNLDIMIGDTEKEIEKRRASLPDAVAKREDIKELIKYIENNNLPDQVKRALDYCLSWNPFTK